MKNLNTLNGKKTADTAASGIKADTSKSSQTAQNAHNAHIRILVIAAVFLFWFSHYVYLPSLPGYIQGKTDTLTQVGIVLSMYGLWQAVVRLPLGIITDRLGKQKLFILTGIFLSITGTVILAFAGGFLSLLIGRSLVGLSMGAWVLQVVYFGSLFSNDELIRAGAVLTLASSLAKFSGTFLTGYLNTWGGYRFTFALAVMASIFSFLVFLKVPEKTVHKAGSVSGMNIWKILTNRKVVIVSVLAALNQFLNFGIVFGFFPIKAELAGVSDVMKSYLLSTNIIFLIGGNLISTWFGKRGNSVKLLALSYLLFSSGIAAIPAAPGLLWFFLFQAMLGAAHGISYPVLIGVCIEDIPSDRKATAMGLHQSIYAVGMFLGPYLAGVIADKAGIDAAFYLMGGCTLAVSFFMLILLGFSAKAPEVPKSRKPRKPKTPAL